MFFAMSALAYVRCNSVCVKIQSPRRSYFWIKLPDRSGGKIPGIRVNLSAGFFLLFVDFSKIFIASVERVLGLIVRTLQTSCEETCRISKSFSGDS